MKFDWNQVRAFLATVEEGSLSGAARVLGLTQPTLSRQVSALEIALEVTLFERVGRSLELTQSGIELLEHVRMMGEAANRISLTASGQSQAIEGQVSITASDVMASFFLPPIIKMIREREPGIEISLIADNEVRDLKKREADIAIRHVRPDQPDLIAKLARQSTASLYASGAYLDRFGRPTKLADVTNAEFIGFEPIDRIVVMLQSMGLPVARDNFKVLANNGMALCELVRQGLGISVIPDDFAKQIPDLERVLPDFESIPVPMWLTTHRELHTSRRIRLVFDMLSEGLAAY